MSDFTSFVEGLIGQLGRTFLMAGFVPMLILIALNQYVFFGPPYAEAVWNLFPAVTEPWLGLLSGPMLTTIIASLILALVLVPLNLLIIRLFEGILPGMKVALFPLFLSQSARHRKSYAAIAAKRAERRALLAEYADSGNYDDDADTALQQELHRLHAQRETSDPAQLLPYDRERLLPTMFGNAWAVMEEYPLARYGMDSMVFWPYLRVVMTKENPTLLEQIDGQKFLIDVTIHLALVAGILSLEGLILFVVHTQFTLLWIGLACLLLFLGFYQAGVGYTRTMGGLVSQGFDLYRLKALDAFGVARPDNLDDEYWVWTRLAAFLRRGEPFYFDLLDRAGGETQDKK